MSRITPLQSGKAKPAARLARDRETKAMDAIVTKLTAQSPRPTREEAEQAVRTLLLWAGDDPEREGLLDTPARVAKAYGELFSGYEADIEDVLGRTFEEVGGYEDMVLCARHFPSSHCEHHMLPVIGKAHVAYLPKGRVLGLSKIARVVDVFAKRLQTQENMTAQIAHAIDDTLQPRGVAVFLEAEHMCMAMRGIQKTGSTTLTTPLPAPSRTMRRTGSLHVHGPQPLISRVSMSAFEFDAPSADKKILEEGVAFTPKFDDHGLVTAVVTDARDGELLMVAHMNAEALGLTLETGIGHYFSRSRGKIWKKGESSEICRR